MPNTIEALARLSEVLATASEAVDDTADALAAAGVNDVRPDATQAGVYGIESSDAKVIAAVLRIAKVVGQTVTIDYRDGYGRETQGREVNPQEVVEGSPYVVAHVIAEDLYRDGETRRFRLDRIQRVSC